MEMGLGNDNNYYESNYDNNYGIVDNEFND